MSLYGLKYRLVLQPVVTSADESPAYMLEHDPSAGVSRILVGKEEVNGPLGLLSIETSETLQDHSASLSLIVGSVGDRLRQLIQPHDHLRIEFAWGGEWYCAFEGFTNQAVWYRSSSPQDVSWRLQVRAQGVHKLYRQQWLNWQTELRITDSKELFGPGSTLYQQLCDGPLEPTEVLKKFLRMASSDLLSIYLGAGPKTGQLGLGTLFQFGEERDWRTYLDLKHATPRTWYYQQQGPLWEIMSSLSEPDLHEFFITYGPVADAEVWTEIPTVVFRPRPFPGAPGDDDDWNALDVVTMGPKPHDPNTEEGAATIEADSVQTPSCVRVMATNDDGQRANHFNLALTCVSDASAHRALQKLRWGCWADVESIKKHGFASRMVSTSLVASETFFEEEAPAILERAAYQEAPLPYLWNQTRTYPLFPPAHVGRVVEDYSFLRDGAPTVGYLVSVSHRVAATPQGVQASTTLGMVRCIEGVFRENYPDAVRQYLHLQHYMPVANEPAEKALEGAKATGGQSQPSTGQDIRRLTRSREAQKINDPNQPDEAAKKNLLKMKAETLDPIEQLIGPVQVNSGYRSPAVNQRVGGASNSLHLKGRAMDIAPRSMSVSAAYDAIVASGIPYTRILKEPIGSSNPTWLHIETAGG